MTETPDHHQTDEDVAAQPQDDDVAAELRDALVDMRSEADRIAALGTGTDQVEAAERFADDAGRLDEQVGSAARAADEHGRG